MDDWMTVTVQTSSEAVEAVSNFLTEAGAVGIQISDASDFQQASISVDGVWFDPETIHHLKSGAEVTGYFDPALPTSELVSHLQARVDALPTYGLAKGLGTVTFAHVAEADWANVWKKYYRPLRVTRYLTVVPQWLDFESQQAGEIPLILDPGMAFGTGSHPTTKLMLALLEQLIRGGEQMIDVGTGSGILAIAAKKLGVSQILATDVDQHAVDNANENIKANGLTGISVRVSDLLSDIEATADLIVANILAEVLLPLIPQVPQHLRAGGHFLLSGIFKDKVSVVIEALTAADFVVTQTLTEGDWVALVAMKKVTEA